ncbi:hypothetical protein [Flagellimonas okinawensis]|uniref:PH domain-containing protein n=1 Tax=Flagellimonas okinawensis TaxID=3031324 RepID=A0ABT5XJG7_9FLAO|nr:hypothetical protein [[Muricauda] okinawensis]MDF0706035.1 hypothetical protein [[Muricauda] okinawensis]
MKVNYNTSDKTIEIEDGLKTHYLVLKMLMILNLGNAALNLYDINKKEIGFIEIVWIVVGLISLVLLYFFIFKKSTQNKLAVTSIERLDTTSLFGRNIFSIVLKNGKKRDLIEIKSKEDFNQLKTLFSNIGIHN